jgi:4'-phosphopantetheinyl transferase
VIRIAPGEVHVWLAEPAALLRSREPGRCAAVLSRAEQRRAAQYRLARDRINFVAGHWLTRAALSWCAPTVAREGWRFLARDHGRPEIAWPELPSRMRFNLSHTDGLVACVVTVGADCGVDVEPFDRMTDLERLAGRVLAASEAASFRAADDGTRAELFARFWTLKEAYAKARGLGLSLPLPEAAFTLGTPVRARLPRDPDGADWRFEQWRASSRHVAALAVRSAAAGPVVLHGAPAGPDGGADPA